MLNDWSDGRFSTPWSF